MKRRVAFHTLGCKVNIAESDVLAATFQQRGYSIVPFGEESDVCVINTCTVTGEADAKSRQVIRQARRNSPEAVIAVVGCYAQSDPETVSRIPGVDIVLGNGEKFAIFDHLHNNSCATEPLVRTEFSANPFEHEKQMAFGTSRTRAFLKIQDGCSYRCSYCIIPSVRGGSVSRGKDDVLRKVRKIRDEGYNEIVLTAVNLGEYENGRDYTLLHLLKDIGRIDGVPRVRLTSIEPNCMSRELVQFVADSGVICNHFHIPLQSGSDAILRRMRRKYMSRHYAAVMNWIRACLPDAAIGADVMVGFPGETDALFAENAAFIRDMPITYMHVFRYSPRKNTDSLGFPGHVSPQAARDRSREMIQIGLRKKENFLNSQIGKTAEVLFETERINGNFEGFTRNYVRVQCGDNAENNSLAPVRLTGKTGMILEGEVVP